MRSDILRQKFLDFFKRKKHKVVESDSLVPKDDPTVLFTPAGMNQFKKQFLGLNIDYRRAASSQRCLRTGDLERVGKTPRHHTFFEMLGNFSFGDYFKQEAISWAWEFLTEVLSIPPDKLWVSVYKDDDEAFRIWRDIIAVPQHKIIKLGDKDNFWPAEAKSKGPNGPCGPCSEIFFDQGKDAGCGREDCTPACGCDRYPEIWNLVFTQYNRKEGGILEPLPQRNIDTGMGLERLSAVMQGVRSNFETDLFAPIVNEIMAKSKEGEDSPRELVYAVSDHVRATVFSVYDGVMPSNEARGYVVRKLIRKSILNLRKLGITKPFLYKLVPVVASVMKAPYPELNERRENIAQIILSEEEAFNATLNSSQRYFQEAGFEGADPVSAAHKAFQLYDTYGIPLELTREWLDKKQIPFSQDVFEQDLEEQKNRSKAQSSMKGDVFDLKGLHLKVKKTAFAGYTNNRVKAKVLVIIKGSSAVKKAGKGDEVRVILDKTVFYPESGGQVGDTGTLTKGKSVFTVEDCQKQDAVILHYGKVTEGSIKTGDELLCSIDSARRLAIARNHTATHLLQAALRKVLGAHVRQQGSLVAEDRLRFDFTHFKGLSKEELGRVEEEVNNRILENIPLIAEEMSLAQAKKSGALAFFGEKYGDKVRVVSVEGVSREFCGGTHLRSTGEIGTFRITQEGSVASGIRRIEAITGLAAYRLARKDADILYEASSMLNSPKDKLIDEIQSRLSRIKALEKEVVSQKVKNISVSADALLSRAERIAGLTLICDTLPDMDMELLRRQVDLIKQKASSAVIALASSREKKAFLVIGITEDLCQKGWDASRLIRQVAQAIGGSGGGRKDFAQAGGTNPEGLPEAFLKLKNAMEGTL